MTEFRSLGSGAAPCFASSRWKLRVTEIAQRAWTSVKAILNMITTQGCAVVTSFASRDITGVIRC